MLQHPREDGYQRRLSRNQGPGKQNKMEERANRHIGRALQLLKGMGAPATEDLRVWESVLSRNCIETRQMLTTSKTMRNKWLENCAHDVFEKYIQRVVKSNDIPLE